MGSLELVACLRPLPRGHGPVVTALRAVTELPARPHAFVSKIVNLFDPSNAPNQRLARVRANKKYLLLQSAVSGCSVVNRVIMFDLILYQGKINSEWWLFAYV